MLQFIGFFFWALASNMTHHLFICGVFSLKQKVSGSLISVEELISDNWSSKSLITRPYSPKKKLNRQIYLGFLYLQQLVFFLIFQIPNSACNSYHPNIVLLCRKEKATEQLKILQFSKSFQVKRREKFFKRRGKTLVGKFKTKNIKYLPSGDIALRELWTQVLKSDWVQRKGENSTWNLPSKPQRNEENLDCAVFCFLSICVGSKLWDQLWRKQMYAKIIKVSTDGDIMCVLRVTWKDICGFTSVSTMPDSKLTTRLGFLWIDGRKFMLAVKHLNWRGGSCKLVGGLCVDKTPWFIFHLTQLLSLRE